MCKDTSKNPIGQEKTLFSLPEIVSGKEIRVDFNAPDISSNGGLLLAGDMKRTLAWRIGSEPSWRLILWSTVVTIAAISIRLLSYRMKRNDCKRPILYAESTTHIARLSSCEIISSHGMTRTASITLDWKISALSILMNWTERYKNFFPLYNKL